MSDLPSAIDVGYGRNCDMSAASIRNDIYYSDTKETCTLSVVVLYISLKEMCSPNVIPDVG